MISQSALSFLEHLALNNHKDRFHEHRDLYDVTKWEFLDFIEKLTEKISRFDPFVTNLDPKKAMFRINRDIRFSKDKSPYKPNLWAVITKWWRKSPYAAYYIHIHPGNNSFIGGWLYRPDTEVVAVVKLPQETFIPSGTGVKTSVLFLRKNDARFPAQRPYGITLAIFSTWSISVITFYCSVSFYTGIRLLPPRAENTIFHKRFCV